MTMQTEFPFVQEIDDERDGTIEGMSPLSWAHRCYYPTAEEALPVAKRAVAKSLLPLYVIEMEVYPGFERYWPHRTHWRIANQKPFTGVCGAYYHGRPTYYTVYRNGEVVRWPGEDPDVVKAKEKEAWDQFAEDCALDGFSDLCLEIEEAGGYRKWVNDPVLEKIWAKMDKKEQKDADN